MADVLMAVGVLLALSVVMATGYVAVEWLVRRRR